MPLSFQTENSGDISFGFFNIESDMLLLENYFFFADRFCNWMAERAESSDAIENEDFEYKIKVIPGVEDIGDLMGAIHGIRFTGFIGDVYKKFPFPADPQVFKQNPLGNKTRQIVTSLIEKYAKDDRLAVRFKPDGKVNIGPYQFDKKVFHELLRYIVQGGYPLWKNEAPPEYVLKMKSKIKMSRHPFFEDVF